MGSEVRQISVTCLIEPSLYALLCDVAAEDKESMSSLIRGVLIRHLRERNVLSEDTMLGILTGQSQRRMEEAIQEI